MNQPAGLIELIQIIGKKHKLAPGKTSGEHAAAIMSLGAPEEAKALISTCWFHQYGQIDSVEFFDVRSIIEESQDDYIRDKNYIPIGKSGNGDLLAIHWKSTADCPVGYLRLSEYTVPELEMSKSFYLISASVREFLTEIQAGYEIPCDSYDCKNPRRKILRKTRWWHFGATR